MGADHGDLEAASQQLIVLLKKAEGAPAFTTFIVPRVPPIVYEPRVTWPVPKKLVASAFAGCKHRGREVELAFNWTALECADCGHRWYGPNCRTVTGAAYDHNPDWLVHKTNDPRGVFQGKYSVS